MHYTIGCPAVFACTICVATHSGVLRCAMRPDAACCEMTKQRGYLHGRQLAAAASSFTQLAPGRCCWTCGACMLVCGVARSTCCLSVDVTAAAVHRLRAALLRTGRLRAHGHAFSFFTRNLARLAAATAKLLADCGQAVDPNLVKLRDAFEVVVAKVGPDRAAALMRGAPPDDPAGAAADGDAAADGAGHPDDLREGLQVLLQGKKVKKKAQKAPSECVPCASQAVCSLLRNG